MDHLFDLISLIQVVLVNVLSSFILCIVLCFKLSEFLDERVDLLLEKMSFGSINEDERVEDVLGEVKFLQLLYILFLRDFSILRVRFYDLDFFPKEIFHFFFHLREFLFFKVDEISGAISFYFLHDLAFDCVLREVEFSDVEVLFHGECEVGASSVSQ